MLQYMTFLHYITLLLPILVPGEFKQCPNCPCGKTTIFYGIFFAPDTVK